MGSMALFQLSTVYFTFFHPCKGDDFANPLKLLARAIRFDDPLTGRERRFESARSL